MIKFISYAWVDVCVCVCVCVWAGAGGGVGRRAFCLQALVFQVQYIEEIQRTSVMNNEQVYSWNFKKYAEDALRNTHPRNPEKQDRFHT